jgi:hypothetical protein
VLAANNELNLPWFVLCEEVFWGHGHPEWASPLPLVASSVEATGRSRNETPNATRDDGLLFSRFRCGIVAKGDAEPTRICVPGKLCLGLMGRLHELPIRLLEFANLLYRVEDK